MPHLLELEEYGHGIGDAAAALRNNANRAGLDAPVPTCPGWTVRDLVTHVGQVHRWAAACVEAREPRRDTDVEAEAASSDDLLAWFDDGLVEVLNALGSAPDDLDVPFFLADAPPARLAWSRRQCHETTIHAVDAMAAALGRPPRADEVWFGRRLATDGVDELLTGMLPLERSRLRYDQPVAVVVRPTDSSAAWTVHAGPGIPRTETDAAVGDPELTFVGPVVDLYLALWNRGGDVQTVGDERVLAGWRELTRIYG